MVPQNIQEEHFSKTVLCDKHLVITVYGIDIISAAQTTQFMREKFNLDYFLFLGIVGGINDNTINIGDVMIAQHWAEKQHQKFIFSNFIDFDIDFPDIFYCIAANRIPAFFLLFYNGCDNPNPNGTSVQDGIYY